MKARRQSREKTINALPRTPRRGRRENLSEVRAAWLMLLPAILLLLAVRLAPILQAVWGSFIEPGRGGHEPTLGLGNYVFLFKQYPTFINSVVTTVKLVVLAVAVQTGLALAMAVLLARQMRAVGLMRTIILLPLAVPVAASTTVWGIILRPEGPLNAVLALVGIEQQPLLTSSSQALFSIVLILTWVVAGYWMTVLTAGLYDIPREFYEAATIDGGGRWQVFRSITLPLLRRPLLFVVVASTVSNFLAFAPVQILTRGGPASSTNVIMYEIYTQAFTNFDLGLASAEITIVLLVLGALVSVQFRLLGKEES